MIQSQFPVRANTANRLQYTFRDQYGVLIDLTSYIAVSVLVKYQGNLFSSTPATFNSPTTSAVVSLASIAFPFLGIWDVQFFCMDAGGNKLYGDPYQFRVVPNIDDLALTDLPLY